MSKKRTMKRRRTVTILVLVIMSFMVNFAFAKQDYKETVEVIVKSGDSLWGIASKNNPGEKDIRKLVYEIIEINDLDGGKIYAGQELLIPVN